ncbi:MAG: hypothetical protein R3Y32_03205 [Bacillota bacterium]
MEERMFEIADKYKGLRITKDDLQFQLKELNKEIDIMERELLNAMVNGEVESFKRNGATFSMVLKEYPSAVAERKQELYDVMKNKGYEYLFTINTNTLSSTLKEMKENNDNEMPDWLEGLVQICEKPSIRLKK